MRSAPTKLGTKHRKAVSNRLLETRAYLFVMPVMSGKKRDELCLHVLTCQDRDSTPHHHAYGQVNGRLPHEVEQHVPNGGYVGSIAVLAQTNRLTMELA